MNLYLYRIQRGLHENVVVLHSCDALSIGNILVEGGNSVSPNNLDPDLFSIELNGKLYYFRYFINKSSIFFKMHMYMSQFSCVCA